MWVVTADQIGSRSDRDRVPDALRALAAIPTVLGFERTVGDEVQAVVTDARAAVDATLLLVRDGHWSVGIGGGSGRLRGSASASDGEAFIRARVAVTRAKTRGAPVPVALELGQTTIDLEPLLQLLVGLVLDRTEAAWRVTDLLDRAMSGVEVARELGITPQAVSQHRRAARWDTEVAARDSLARLLERESTDATMESEDGGSGGEHD